MRDMGFRRLPHPPMPIVMPERSSATTSSSVARLSGPATVPLSPSRLTERQVWNGRRVAVPLRTGPGRGGAPGDVP